MSDSLGVRFAHALADKDDTALRGLLAEDVDFKALTPGRTWEAGSPGEVVDIAFGHWFEETDKIVGLVEATDGAVVGDTEHVSYRVDVDNPDGEYVVEQQVYYRGSDDDRIAYARIVCSGYRPR